MPPHVGSYAYGICMSTKPGTVDIGEQLLVLALGTMHLELTPVFLQPSPRPRHVKRDSRLLEKTSPCPLHSNKGAAPKESCMVSRA